MKKRKFKFIFNVEWNTLKSYNAPRVFTFLPTIAVLIYRGQTGSMSNYLTSMYTHDKVDMMFAWFCVQLKLGIMFHEKKI